MKICHVGTGFVPVHPGSTGGAEKYVHYLSAALQGLGHQVNVIDMPADVPAPDEYRRLDVPLRWRGDSNLVAHALRGLLFGRDAARRLEQLIEANEVELVNFHSQFTAVSGAPVARRYGIPAVFTMHNPLWSDAAACRSRWQRAKFWLERRAEAQADAVIGLSRTVIENRVRYFGLSPAKVAVAPVGLDGSWFEPAYVSSRVRNKYAPNREPVILAVGRVAPYKNQLLLARALPHVLTRVSNVRLVFVGPEDSPSYLRRVWTAVAEAGAEAYVTFAGSVPLHELAQLYGLARVVALPSLRENCPQALLEAMAQGKAIVASDIPPLREILPEGTAALAPSADPELLAQELVRLLLDDRAAEEMGSRARRRASEVYRWERVAHQAETAYERIVAGRAASMELSRSFVS